MWQLAEQKIKRLKKVARLLAPEAMTRLDIYLDGVFRETRKKSFWPDEKVRRKIRSISSKLDVQWDLSNGCLAVVQDLSGQEGVEELDRWGILYLVVDDYGNPRQIDARDIHLLRRAAYILRTARERKQDDDAADSYEKEKQEIASAERWNDMKREATQSLKMRRTIDLADKGPDAGRHATAWLSQVNRDRVLY